MDNFKERLEWGLPRMFAFYVFTLLEKWFGFHVYRVWVSSGLFGAKLDQLPQAIPEAYPTRRVEPRDLIPYVSAENKLSEAFLKGAQARGDVATVVFHKEKIVSYGFESHTRTPFEHGLELIVPPGFRYGYKSWTHSDFRRKGLTKLISKVKWDERRAQGRLKRRIWYIKFHNYPSLLTDVYEPPHQRPIHVGTLVVLKIIGRTLCFNSRRAKWFGSVLVRKSQPAYRTYPYT